MMMAHTVLGGTLHLVQWKGRSLKFVTVRLSRVSVLYELLIYYCAFCITVKPLCHWQDIVALHNRAEAIITSLHW